MRLKLPFLMTRMGRRKTATGAVLVVCFFSTVDFFISQPRVLVYLLGGAFKRVATPGVDQRRPLPSRGICTRAPL